MKVKKHLTQKMVDALIEEREELQNELRKVQKRRGNCLPVRDVECGVHPELRDINNEEESIIIRITEINDTLSNYELVELSHKKDEVGIGTDVIVNLTKDGKLQPDIIKISFSEVGNRGGNSFSLGSPIGHCILGKKVGFEGRYQVDNTWYTVKIIEIIPQN